eukprot:TRINITY_DN1168_c0_g1_i3.p1 TRINITY_DN1168_c0_g1~~TRINITY_DN1168_c0_g1_i3.p1  ORF type:complete len:347 (+),score=78.92 TRINITY_DN1168_c0_g1_i3:64-1104(+)
MCIRDRKYLTRSVRISPKIQRFNAATPKEFLSNLDKVVEYFAHETKDDFLRIAYIFLWVSENIQFDMEKFVRGHTSNIKSDAIIKTKRTLAEGFASMFVDMASKLNIRAEKIYGYAKGFNYSAGQRFVSVNHVWNAVRLEEEWYLLDLALANGVLANGVFRKEVEMFYFLTPPEIFANSHFPLDKRWQLLKLPISLDNFERQIRFNTDYYKHGFDLMWPRESTIRCKGKFEIYMKTNENILLAYSHTRKSGYGTLDRSNILIKDGYARIWIEFEEKGEHRVFIWAEEKNRVKVFKDLFSYRVIVEQNTSIISLNKEREESDFAELVRLTSRFLNAVIFRAYNITIP